MLDEKNIGGIDEVFPGFVPRCALSGTKLLWNEAHRRYIARHYRMAAKPEMARKLGVSASTLYRYAQEIGLISGVDARQKSLQNNTRWTREEVVYLREHYGKGGISRIARSLNRGVSCVYVKACKLGLTTQVEERLPWSEEETDILRSYYPVLGPKAARAHLKRTMREIYAKGYELGLTRRRKKSSCKSRPKKAALKDNMKNVRRIVRPDYSEPVEPMRKAA